MRIPQIGDTVWVSQKGYGRVTSIINGVVRVKYQSGPGRPFDELSINIYDKNPARQLLEDAVASGVNMVIPGSGLVIRRLINIGN